MALGALGIDLMLPAFDEIRAHLPADTRTISADERRERIRVRREHVQRRYRVF